MQKKLLLQPESFTFKIIIMSDFTFKKGSEDRSSSPRTNCVFDWTPDEVVGIPYENHSENRSSVILESDILPDLKS